MPGFTAMKPAQAVEGEVFGELLGFVTGPAAAVLGAIAGGWLHARGSRGNRTSSRGAQRAS